MHNFRVNTVSAALQTGQRPRLPLPCFTSLPLLQNIYQNNEGGDRELL